MRANSAGPGALKRELRAEQAAARDRLSASEREVMSALACRHAWEWVEQQGAIPFMAYAPFRSELDSRPLLLQAWKGRHEVILPRVVPGTWEMTLHSVRSWEELAPGAYGILEPAAAHEEIRPGEPSLPAAVFVPGLAFDRRGGRLGYGSGYYDRLREAWTQVLPVSAAPPVWIGLGYGMQLVAEVPMDEHDAFMDMLITENGILHCRKGE
ncbi:5-formyltetrahydrofolate cyclo-ligase [Paenibacillus albidus]|uniref:5-formyltetrahydrofolate cyclo-ligase n=1 Tax=Paenibacillus albidus TaxID=2041023 RepID=A0A917CEU0_9BACL|nr:5-formyltetrahydrofolate cyclo-ligase [Paenibacillus albidus]GGF83133.1 5-formyltetrahydrofolate cyclo-ligase [Paenibacillus albidus]